MPEWGIALIGVAGLIVGVIITEVRHWLDRRQRFQVMTFEKRLEAHQKAFYWLNKINVSLAQNKLDLVKELIEQAWEWLYANSLLLDEKSRHEMARYFAFASKYSPIKAEQDWQSISSCAQAIVKGIGFRYLPEYHPQSEELKKRALTKTKKRQ